MLWFLHLAAERKTVIDSYTDEAVGIMAKNAEGKLAMTEVTLRPHVGCDISESELLGHLISEAGNDLIETVGDVDIVWLDDKCNKKKNKVSGLKDMLYRAKEKLNKSQ